MNRDVIWQSLVTLRIPAREDALQLGKVDLDIAWCGGYFDPDRALCVRAQAGRS